MNSVANGKVYERTPFQKLYIQPSPGDAGGAIGAGLVACSRLYGRSRPPTMDHAFIGPRFEKQSISKVLYPELSNKEIQINWIQNEKELLIETAQALVGGKVVGWFQGRMEWGPRALGNRSILCDPRRTDIKEVLNRKIKRRESFRPFAPSILREQVSEWFVQDDDVPFMEKVFQIVPSKRAMIPGVAHVDGSGRLQTVTREANPRYYGLMKIFYSLTGIPILLNTSFNENEPIVCGPKEALECFLRTRMDVLVLGDYVVKRTG